MQTIKEFTEAMVSKRIITPGNRIKLEIQLIKYWWGLKLRICLIQNHKDRLTRKQIYPNL